MIYIDAHVHLHDCFHLIPFFDHIEKNIQSRLKYPLESGRISGCLFLTEPSNANYFERIRNNGLALTRRGLNEPAGWRVLDTSESVSMLISNELGFRILLIAGQQLQTAEGLEVLAIAPTYRLTEGGPLGQIISEVIEAGALAIIPWGFGKWMGRRGKVLQGILERATPPEFFLGDNSGRPKFMPEPYLFRLAKQNSVRILPGSDPLPFPDEVSRAGSFGLLFKGEINRQKPAGDLKVKLTNPEHEFETFGQLETAARFFKHQVLMQLVKRKAKIFK
jgi:hypothetical protein